MTVNPSPATLPRDWLPIVIERIVRRFDPVRIILCGSHARGEERPDTGLPAWTC